MLKEVLKFYKRNDLRVINSTWLAYVHVLALLGAIYWVYRYDVFFQLLVIFFAFEFPYALGITAGVHRLWSHKSYEATLPLRIFLMLCNCGSFQGPIFSWTKDHRLHHKFSDTKLDPHNITQGFFFSHIGWLLKHPSKELSDERHKIDMEDIKKDSVVMFQRRHFFALAFFMGYVIPTIVFSLYIPVVPAFLMSALLNCYSLNATWCVNSLCHMFGTRKWNPKIEPRDNYFVTMIAYGEGYHNWHHQYPADWRASKNEWYMVNFTTTFLTICGALGLAKLKK